MTVLLFGIRVIQGTVWWHELIGPALLAGTAIAAATIAARTANSRQQEQLSHDRELQAQQLAYDRDQRNRQHVRDTVDGAVANLDSSVRLIAAYEGALQIRDAFRIQLRDAAADASSGDETRREAEKALEKEEEDLGKASQAVYGAATDLVSQSLRLSLRLGSGHAIVTHHRAYAEAYDMRHDTVRECDRGSGLTEADEMKMGAASDTSYELANEFIHTCEAWFNEG